MGCAFGSKATLARDGYRTKEFVEQFYARSPEFWALFNNTLDPERAAELRDKILAVGISM